MRQKCDKVGEGRCLQVIDIFGGPGRDRTDDLFHAMEARSQLRHRPTERLFLFSLRVRQSSNEHQSKATSGMESSSREVEATTFPASRDALPTAPQAHKTLFLFSLSAGQSSMMREQNRVLHSRTRTRPASRCGDQRLGWRRAFPRSRWTHRIWANPVRQLAGPSCHR